MMMTNKEIHERAIAGQRALEAIPEKANAQHTPKGLIVADTPRGNRWEIWEDDGLKVAEVLGTEEMALILAAAPDLLATCKAIAAGEEMTGIFTHADTVLHYQEIARKAVAKAEGRE